MHPAMTTASPLQAPPVRGEAEISPTIHLADQPRLHSSQPPPPSASRCIDSVLPKEILTSCLIQVKLLHGIQALFQCLQVSSSWYQLARPLLYSDVVLTNKRLEAFVTTFGQANAPFIRSITLDISPIRPRQLASALENPDQAEDIWGGMVINGSSETQDLWADLGDLADLLPSFENLASFSMRVQSNAVTAGFWIDNLVMIVLVESLPPSCTALELDTRGLNHGWAQNGHLCHVLRDKIAGLKHLRLRLFSMCSGLFGHGPTLLGNPETDKTPLFTPISIAHLDSLLVNTNVKSIASQTTAFQILCCTNEFLPPLLMPTPGTGSDGRLSVLAALNLILSPQGNPSGSTSFENAGMNGSNNGNGHSEAKSNGVANDASTNISTPLYSPKTNMTIMSCLPSDNEDPSIYAAIIRTDLIARITWVTPHRHIAGSRRDGHLFRLFPTASPSVRGGRSSQKCHEYLASYETIEQVCEEQTCSSYSSPLFSSASSSSSCSSSPVSSGAGISDYSAPTPAITCSSWKSLVGCSARLPTTLIHARHRFSDLYVAAPPLLVERDVYCGADMYPSVTCSLWRNEKATGQVLLGPERRQGAWGIGEQWHHRRRPGGTGGTGETGSAANGTNENGDNEGGESGHNEWDIERPVRERTPDGWVRYGTELARREEILYGM